MKESSVALRYSLSLSSRSTNTRRFLLWTLSKRARFQKKIRCCCYIYIQIDDKSKPTAPRVGRHTEGEAAKENTRARAYITLYK